MTELKVVRAAERDPVARGRTIGRGFRDEIGRSIEFYRRYFGRRDVDERRLEELLAPFVGAARSSLPRLAATLEGMAEGAGVPPAWLWSVNAFEELDPVVGASRVERCSSFVVTGPGVTILAHNEQWLAGDAGLAGVVVDVPDDGTAIVSPTVVSWLPAVGMNSSGTAQAIMSLAASDDGVGVPRVPVSRHSLESTDRADALRRAALSGRAGGYAHMYAFAGGEAFVIETTGSRHAVLEGPLPHTNHYLAPELAEIGEAPSSGSLSRYARLRELLAERRPQTPGAAMEVLRDHASDPQAVCVHPDPAEGDEGDAIVFSMVCDVEARRMWVAPGQPCEAGFVEIDLDRVL